MLIVSFNKKIKDKCLLALVQQQKDVKADICAMLWPFPHDHKMTAIAPGITSR